MSFLERVGSGLVAGWYAIDIFRRMRAGEISEDDAAEFRDSPERYFRMRHHLPVFPYVDGLDDVPRGVLSKDRFSISIDRRGIVQTLTVSLYQISDAASRMQILARMLEGEWIDPLDFAVLGALRVQCWKRLPDEPVFAIRDASQCSHGHWLVPFVQKRVIDFHSVELFPPGSLFAVEEQVP